MRRLTPVPPLGRSSRRIVRSVRPRRYGGNPRLRREVLLERDSELARIGDALDGACAGGGSSIVIEGGAGIGKTSLLDAARVGAEERRMTVLHARGTELEAEYPFGVVRQCLE